MKSKAHPDATYFEAITQPRIRLSSHIRNIVYFRSRKWPRDSTSLREIVGVKNTVKKLEREVRAEIMAVFDLPASMG